ncbi:ATP-dependent DNA ligase [Bacillus salacetis]|uniref:ATP-dependent DNA ligase n=1 Tax=Bacillus salacetis TaxID=2315464 RepID=A0A3A1QN19_9BACI|nr:ATP-dependent DNA ligase [Bacillus salacetis]
MIGAEGVRSPAGLAGQVRPRLRTHRNVTPEANPAPAASA